MPWRSGVALTRLVGLAALACYQEPAEVYVPAPGYAQSIAVTTEKGEHATVRVGEPLVLHGRRRSGPWTLVPRESLEPGACWLVEPAPALEPEVASNLDWDVEPAGAATFNTGLRTDRTREVRFSRPGRYTLTARSAVWCPPSYEGNPLTVDVVPE